MNEVLLASQNPIKLEEVREIFPAVEVLPAELCEVQSADPRVVVRHKAEQVVAMGLSAPVIVEDTGLAIASWQGLPGALVKSFLGQLGAQGLKEISGTGEATATSAVGMILGAEYEIWTGELSGRLVDSRGDLGGWTPVFEVAGTGKTLAEMGFEERMRHTMRRTPLEAACRWLNQRLTDRVR